VHIIKHLFEQAFHFSGVPVTKLVVLLPVHAVRVIDEVRLEPIVNSLFENGQDGFVNLVHFT
jgi:hypothetical protein